MEIVLTRRWRGKESTLGTLTVDGSVHHFVVEDTDRGLSSKMPLKQIKALKVHGRTAIPTGRYEVVISHSARFKRLLPILVGVPGFSGIRIHPGNRAIDTEGCICPGITWWKESEDYAVGSSRTACDRLQSAITAAISRSEKVWFTVQADYK